MKIDNSLALRVALILMQFVIVLKLLVAVNLAGLFKIVLLMTAIDGPWY